MKTLEGLFDKPKIIILVSDTNAGKSNTLYYILQSLQETSTFSLYHFGLRANLPFGTPIYSTTELESVQNSLVVLDEVMTMWDLDNRKQKRSVETSLRLIHHNNNILILSMVPENIKKFIASKADIYIFKKCTIPDFINGSVAKRIVEMYAGPERGSTILNVPINQAIVYDGLHYYRTEIPYMEKFDTKKGNEPIFKTK
jgi:hypothetical protein